MKLRIVIIGGFKKTKSLAISLIKKGYHVTAINADREHCNELAEIEKLRVFNGDGSMPTVLEDANVYNTDIAIALADVDEDNLVICELCKKKFNVKKTVALISDPKKTSFFHRMGIDSVVCAITTIASVIEQNAFLDEMTEITPIADGRISIAQVPVLSGAPVVNMQLRDVELPKQVIIGCILRGDSSIVPRGDTRILAGDMLVVLSAAENEVLAIKELTGR